MYNSIYQPRRFQETFSQRDREVTDSKRSED